MLLGSERSTVTSPGTATATSSSSTSHFWERLALYSVGATANTSTLMFS